METLAPLPDACAETPTFSWPRFALFTVDFLIFIPVSLILFLLLSDRPYGIQGASLVCYTAAVILYTFSSNRNMPRYLFRCPIVRQQLPRLALRHIYFLGALFVLQTAVLQLAPKLPPFWSTSSGDKRMPPLYVGLSVLSVALCLIQTLTNRSLLKRAHRKSEED